MSEPGVNALRAVEIAVPDLEASALFYERVWGLCVVEQNPTTCYLRASGPDAYVLALHSRAEAGLVRVRLGAENRGVIDALYERVGRAGGKPQFPPRGIVAPGGGYGFAFLDGEDREFLVVCDAAVRADPAPLRDRPFKLSHVVFNSREFDKAAAFMRDALGFRLRDRTRKANFMGCNADHHCIAYTDRKNTALSHVAYELPNLDAVLRGCGRLKREGLPIEWGVGRHGTGDNVFAYFVDPNGFAIEYTTEMQQIDDAAYVPGTPESNARASHADVWGYSEPPSQRFLRALEGPSRKTTTADDK